MAAQDYSAWVGQSELRSDEVTAGPATRLSATIESGDPAFGDDASLPPLAHWLYFLPQDKYSALGPDGHARRGGFLPPVHALPRRMWAGGRFEFFAALRVGMKIERQSTITQVETKTGSAGPLIFVTVRHEIRELGGPVLVVEDHDIVYRGLGGPAVTPARTFEGDHAWERMLVPDPVMLFRYSALTFNGHRIHFDRDYATKEEGYPGLVVHGPLVATLLLDLARRNRPDDRIKTFAFRALAPVFDGGALTLKGQPDMEDANAAQLWSENDAGGRTMTARVTFSDGS